ncbi:hypothetical protein LCGC14_1995370 [marine sediment metagenome]|uniref:Uncharacterized protein n=1 Tax=marine sediment metagenome TaxID=412755 RepID=A0A0F9F537_9ZZZZ
MMAKKEKCLMGWDYATCTKERFALLDKCKCKVCMDMKKAASIAAKHLADHIDQQIMDSYNA